ncbi:hypothetical protein MOQ72_22845 [Saccharopolyspora sp. K220]|uniref:hypothetical protein n=1 Tax=Saccharopolyspora soli TaxID=2926618 RepID=UPI001F5A98A2|nr:hypothetical protein [Saccharopolyspora soli]MCI2420286.1 hypothetical protein [Saccharopolyspora soli]
MTSLMQQLPDTRPAGGAALDQILIAAGSATLLTALLLLLGHGHRTGRTRVLARLAALAERSWSLRGLPGWAALPMQLALGSLALALLGMYWDISLHITHGRDAGPLANIAHYPILFGLFGLFAAGMLAIVLPMGERPGRAAVRITRGWYAPTGGILLAAASFYALLGFPLDDIWHRIFGQDVTLWGPTHLMLIGGAGLSLVAIALLEREGRFVRTEQTETMLSSYLRRGMIAGGLLAGLSVFQAEFDFGVPQFRLVHQPLLIAVAAGCALVVARLWVGRGGALFAVGFYVLLRGGVSVAVGPVIGQLWAAIPLYVVEALCVEIAAVALLRRPLALGAVSGLLIGTIGFASEYLWTQVAFVLPWTSDMVVEGAGMAIVGGVSGGLLGALLVGALRGELPRPAVRRVAFGGALLAIALGITNGLIGTAPAGVAATVALDRQTGQAEVRLDPPTFAQDPAWLAVTGWQGGGLHVDRLQPLGDGRYRTTRPMPLDGTWKTMLRLHDGRAMLAIPVFMPADAALGLPEIAADPQFTRDGQPEWQVLQRETKRDVPPWLWISASLVVLACSVALVLALGWGAQRLSRAISGPDRSQHPVVVGLAEDPATA